MRRLLANKLERLSYLMILMWIFMGVVALIYHRGYGDLAVYFLSLSGFAATYVYGQTKRPTKGSALFTKGKSSARETMLYWVIAIWFFLGIVGLVKDSNLQEMGAYFAALTPFVSAFIIGNTFKQEGGVNEPEIEN